MQHARLTREPLKLNMRENSLEKPTDYEVPKRALSRSQYIARDASRLEVIIFSMGFDSSRHRNRINFYSGYCRVKNILTLGKLLSLWFCFLLHSISFLISQTSYRTYKIISSYKLARPVMGTIFLVYKTICHSPQCPQVYQSKSCNVSRCTYWVLNVLALMVTNGSVDLYYLSCSTDSWW